MPTEPLFPRRSAAPAVPAPEPSHASVLAAMAPVARSSVVDAVSKRLQSEILAGRLAAGSRLPSERELSVALGVNRLTLRAALARLEAQGLIVTRHGAATLVASWRERAGLETLSLVLEALEPGDDAYHEIVASLLEVRRILVSEAIALAASRHKPEDLEEMRRCAREQEARVHDVIAFAEGEIAFQRALVRAAGNVGLELLLNTFARFPQEQPALIELMYDRCEPALAFYDVVIDVIRSGDEKEARDAVRDALTAVDADWMARHGVRPRGRAAKPASKSKIVTKSKKGKGG